LPQDKIVSCSDNVQELYEEWLATAGGAVASDICTERKELELVLSNEQDPLVLPNCDGETTRTVGFAYVDRCGLSTVTEFANFIIRNVGEPGFIIEPKNKIVECGENVEEAFGEWLATNAGSLSSVSCGTSQITHNNPQLNRIPDGSCRISTEAEFTATSCTGQQVTRTAIFEVVDTTKPSWNFFPGDLDTECSLTPPSALAGMPVAFDSCFGDISVGNGLTWTDSISTTAGTTCAVISIERKWTARDSCGNAIARRQIVGVDPNCPEPSPCPVVSASCPNVCSATPSPPSSTPAVSQSLRVSASVRISSSTAQSSTAQTSSSPAAPSQSSDAQPSQSNQFSPEATQTATVGTSSSNTASSSPSSSRSPPPTGPATGPLDPSPTRTPSRTPSSAPSIFSETDYTTFSYPASDPPYSPVTQEAVCCYICSPDDDHFDNEEGYYGFRIASSDYFSSGSGTEALSISFFGIALCFAIALF